MSNEHLKGLQNAFMNPNANISATKHDGGKEDMSLLSTIAIKELTQVLDFGKRKYASHNWRKGMQWTRLSSAALRHIFAWIGGEDKDPESGLSHLAHAMCCLMFLLEYKTTRASLDDRYKSEVSNESV